MKDYLPKLTLFINAISWSPDYPKLIENQHLKTIAESGESRLHGIADLAALKGGPIECLEKLDDVEKPF